MNISVLNGVVQPTEGDVYAALAEKDAAIAELVECLEWAMGYVGAPQTAVTIADDAKARAVLAKYKER